MNTAEQMSALAGHLRLCGWEHIAGPIAGHGVAVAAAGGATVVQQDGGLYATRTYGTWTNPRHPEYTVHLAPVGHMQVNERTADGANLRLLVLRVTGAVAAMAVLHALDVVDQSDMQQAATATQETMVDQGTSEDDEGVSKPHSGPQDPPEAQEPAP